jgi:hypothetical protein
MIGGATDVEVVDVDTDATVVVVASSLVAGLDDDGLVVCRVVV